eukprot:1033186-Amorphochlora_amoeboformis.AAC.1
MRVSYPGPEVEGVSHVVEPDGSTDISVENLRIADELPQSSENMLGGRERLVLVRVLDRRTPHTLHHSSG